jgi:hypothetical protein
MNPDRTCKFILLCASCHEQDKNYNYQLIHNKGLLVSNFDKLNLRRKIFNMGWNQICSSCQICVLVIRAKHDTLFPKGIYGSGCAYIELIVNHRRRSHNFFIQVVMCKYIQFIPCFKNSYYSISGGDIDPAVGGYGRGKIRTGCSQTFPIK